MKSYKKQIDMGLSIEGGRLINERPDGMTGIQLAAKMKRARKRMDKVDMIAEMKWLVCVEICETCLRNKENNFPNCSVLISC